jgi:opacity protein-like surface antigen
MILCLPQPRAAGRTHLDHSENPKMKAAVSGILLSVAASLIADAALAQAPAAPAQSAYRDKRWEFTIQARGVEGKDLAFEGGTTVTTKDALGFGLGVSYNVNPFLNIGGEFVWVSQDYEATVLGTGGSYVGRGNVDIGAFMLNATWHILAGPLTPYLSAGFGSTTVDSNIPSGPPGNYCWYYPYGGYYCGTYVPTYSETSFSYNAGAGIRWDFSREMFMRFGAQQQWTDFSGTTDSYPSNTVWRLELGFKN